ncbi:hypothetical protein L484_010865 [Morus notabilis]|uniref:Malectin-like domain-containing protein n=1 Tax=Morus notabilis TaxID=981085 RepID=W9SCC5_9ROSA|nr:hypothetical protein L484_010865 [Morus notabilis]
MENYWSTVILVFLLAAVPPSFQQDLTPYCRGYKWIVIDCGAANTFYDGSIGKTWETDDSYIQAGEKKLVSISTIRDEMKTLRCFPSGPKNCYNLPLENHSNYLFVPVFCMETMTTFKSRQHLALSNDTIYHEFIFTTGKKGHVNVCLIQTQANQIPFISSLEAAPVEETTYRLMTKNMALYFESRINYGANQSVPERLPLCVDLYSRIWKPEQVSRYRNIDDFIGWTWLVAENYPPSAVLETAIVANNASESIFLPINFREKYQVLAYFVLYFDASTVHPFMEESETTKLDIFVDGQLVNITQFPIMDSRLVVSVCPVNVTGGTANLTISVAEGATTPPFLNGLEVFSVIGVSKAVRSSTDLSVFKTFFGLVMFSLYVVL